MEGERKMKQETVPREILRIACEWAEKQENEILDTGNSLTSEEITLAMEVGVHEPTKVRILEVDAVPSLDDETLAAVAVEAGLDFSKLKGLTLGHGIYIVRGCRQNWLVSHELRHVQQYEEVGSLPAFLEQYIAELQRYGYRDAPMEIDAKNHEIL